MKHYARITAVAAMVALMALIGGTASAAPPSRSFSADFRNASGSVIIPCVLTGATNPLSLRVTKLSKQGPHMRTVYIEVAAPFSGVSVGAPTSSSGSWTSASSVNSVGLRTGGSGQLKGGDWVQVPITATAPSTVGVHTWQVQAWGPNGTNGPQYSIVGTQPTVHVVTDHDDCPPGTTPIPTPTDGDGDGDTGGQSGAGTPCISPTITGGAGDSLIIGTPGNDVILDLLGNNHVEGRGGNDVVCTGPGNDVVLTLNGSDVLFDQGGNNLLRSSGGNDKITAGDGNDRIGSGNGADQVAAGAGRNFVRLGKGRDRAFAGNGRDVIRGARGKDTIRGGGGRNRLGGGKGNDKLIGGRQKDFLNGSAGRRDVCRGGRGKVNVFRGCEIERGRGAS